MVSEELAGVAERFGTPRRTVLLEGSGKPTRSAAVPLEVADDPCLVLLSSAGLIARTAAAAAGTLDFDERRRPTAGRSSRGRGPHTT